MPSNPRWLAKVSAIGLGSRLQYLGYRTRSVTSITILELQQHGLRFATICAPQKAFR
jgi:hypothetical protein